MHGKGLIKWLLVAAVVALPLLLMTGAAHAESGCHRTGGPGNPPAGIDARDR